MNTFFWGIVVFIVCIVISFIFSCISPMNGYDCSRECPVDPNSKNPFITKTTDEDRSDFCSCGATNGHSAGVLSSGHELIICNDCSKKIKES